MDFLYQALNGIGYTHPVHPALNHVPMGIVIGALVFGVTGFLFRRRALEVTARHCILLALIAVFPTIFLGYMDWQYYHAGNWMFPIKMKITLSAILVMLLVITVFLYGKSGPASGRVLILYAFCFLTVVVIGYYGGEIVYGAPWARPPAREEAQRDLRGEEITFSDVSVIFNQNCIMCHKGASAPLGLELDTYTHVMAGSKNGWVVIPGKPDESELVKRIKGISEPRMPFAQPPLSRNKIETIVGWIEQGAPGGDLQDAE
jgi:uncharacterized membrane protein